MKFDSFFYGIAWLVLVTVLLCLPGSTLPMAPLLEAIHADKWVHIFLFLLLIVLFGLPLRNQVQEKKDRWLLLVTLLGICYGTAMEFVQKYWVINRSFEIADIFADSAGCLFGWWISRKNWGWGKKIGPDRNRDRNQN